MSLHSVLVSVTGLNEFMSVAGLPGLSRGMIIPLFHCFGTMPRVKLLLNSESIAERPFLPIFFKD